MGKAKKGLLLAGTIITIVGSIFAIIAAILVVWLGSKISEAALVELFRSSPEMYEYKTNFQGYSYVFLDLKTGEYMLPETIAMTAGLFRLLFGVLGFIILAFATIKLILAIVALAKSGKKFSKGAVITLIVFSFLTASILEGGLLIGALCAKGEKSAEDQPMPETLA